MRREDHSMPGLAAFDRECADFVAIGSLLLGERQRAEINPDEMARKIGLSVQQLRAVETGDIGAVRGDAKLFLRTVLLYARKLGISINMEKPDTPIEMTEMKRQIQQIPAFLQPPTSKCDPEY